MKKTSFLILIGLVWSAPADQIVSPPLNTQTVTGVWEALPSQRPATLWHMEISGKNDSYLAQMTVGNPSIVVRRLVSMEIQNGNIKLHFEGSLQKFSPTDIWIVGSGEATETDGVIEGRISSKEPSLHGKNDIEFIKGPWTRGLGDASKKAEEAIGKFR